MRANSIAVAKVIALITIFSSSQVMAADLLDIYNMAIKSDPLYKQSIAQKNATLENRPQAISQLLPNISLTANTSSNDQDISSARIGTIDTSGSVTFNRHGYNLNLTQPLFRWDRIIELNQADSEILQAEAEVIKSEQDLIVRVAERYFEILASQDNLEFARAEKKSLNRQLDQAKQRFEVGLTAITDVQEAQAGHDRAVAGEILALNELDNAREAMREIINVYPQKLSMLGAEMPLVEPEPAAIDEWSSISLEQNMDVISARHALEISQEEVKLQSAGHYPTLDFVANRGYNRSGGRFGNTQIHATEIGIELSVPLFQGGATSSRVRQAHENYNLTLEQLEQARRAAQRSTREAYLGVISGISQVKALKQALVSSETALQATVAGFEVGTRTAVDVVASERSTFSARRDYSRARYDYILNILKLKQAAGTLSSEDLQHVSQWLIN